jgi:archaellum component FlaD/FlaE
MDDDTKDIENEEEEEEVQEVEDEEKNEADNSNTVDDESKKESKEQTDQIEEEEPINEDEIKHRIFMGEMNDLPSLSSKIVRIFTSSTFTGNFLVLNRKKKTKPLFNQSLIVIKILPSSVTC